MRLLRTVLLCAAFAAALPALAITPSELEGLWRGEGSTLEIASRAEDGGAHLGRLVSLSAGAAERGFSYDDVVLDSLVVNAQDGVRFRVFVRPEDARQARTCGPEPVTFVGFVRQGLQELDGERERVQFAVDASGQCKVTHTNVWVGMRLRRVDAAPACCAALAFRCDALEPDELGLEPGASGGAIAGRRDECRLAETEAKHRCASRDAFRETFLEHVTAGDAGTSKFRVVEIFNGYASAAIALAGEPGARVYLASDKRDEVGGRAVWRFDAASPPLKDEQYRALVVLSLGDGQLEAAVTRGWRTHAELARNYLEEVETGLGDTCKHLHTVGAENVAGMAMFAGVFENSGVPEFRQGWLELQKSYAVMVNPQATMVQRAAAFGEVSAGTLARLLRIPGGLREAVGDFAGRAAAAVSRARRELEALRRQRALAAAAERPKWDLLIRDAEEAIRANEELTRGARELVEFIDDNGELALRTQLLSPRPRAELLEALRHEVPRTRGYNLLAEQLGVDSVKKAYGAAEVPGFWRPHRPHRHGPDAAFVETAEDLAFPQHATKAGPVDVLVEAKTRSGVTRQTPPSAVLSTLVSGARQHSPRHIKDFSRRRINVARERIRYLERADQQPGVSLVAKAQIARSLEEWRAHEKYWRDIAARVDKGTHLRLEVILTDARSGDAFLWRWDHARSLWTYVRQL